MSFKLFVVIAATLLSSSLGFSAETKSSVLKIENLQTEASYASHYFGRIPVNSMRAVEFYIRNTGEKEMLFEGAYIGGPFFDAYHNCEKPLQPQERCFVEIRYWPAFTGVHQGRLEMQFNEDEDIFINLMGEAFQF